MKEEEAPPELLAEIIDMVAEWLLIEGCAKKSAVQRLHRAGGTKREATAMVEIVHSLLQDQLGRKYQRFPLEDRQGHFHQLDEVLAEFASAQRAEESLPLDRTRLSSESEMEDDLSDDELDEGIEAILTMVAEWLLVERCNKRVAIRRLHAAGGTKREAKPMVRLVNIVLKRGLGWRHQTRPEEERQAHFLEMHTGSPSTWAFEHS